MARRTRAKEALAQLMVNGQRRGGSMLKILELDINIDAEIVKQMLNGEKRASLDLNVNGIDGSFKTHVQDRIWLDVWQLISDAEELGAEMPVITIALTLNLRGTPKPSPIVLVLGGDMILKLDSLARPEEGYVNTSWSFSCQNMNG